MRPYRVHVVYEHGSDRRPYSPSHIRLLRPLTHPSLASWVDMSAGPELGDEPVDLVAIDRLWRDNVSVEQAEQLVDEVRRRGSRLLYSLDDNLILLFNESGEDLASRRKLGVLNVFLKGADRVIVSTWPLQEVVRQANTRVSVIPNYLDERLLPYAALGSAHEYRRRIAEWRRSPDAPIRIGYMGTRTHDDDLALVTRALQAVCRRHPGRISLEILGGIGRSSTRALLHGMPYRELEAGVLGEYPTFLPWFCGTCRWHIGLAPLADTAFNHYKSDIKFLDYAALGAAGIFSRVLYERSVRHRVTGWLVDNTTDAWERAIEHLVTHPVEAMSMGWSAQRYLRRYRVLAEGSALWLNAIRQAMTVQAA